LSQPAIYLYKWFLYWVEGHTSMCVMCAYI
jgi:hypothetical protein